MSQASNASPFKDIWAWVPIVLALVALALVLSYVTAFGAAREPDEGAVAHIWQLLMAVQVPLIVVYAVRWFGRRNREALAVIGLQVLAALSALAPVVLLGL